MISFMGIFVLTFFLLMSHTAISVLSFNRFFIGFLFNSNPKLGSVIVKRETNRTLLYLGLLFLTYSISMFVENINVLGLTYIFPHLAKISSKDMSLFLYSIESINIILYAVSFSSVLLRYFKDFKNSIHFFLIKFVLLFLFAVFVFNFFININGYEISRLFIKVIIVIFFHYTAVNNKKSTGVNFPNYYKAGTVIFFLYLFSIFLSISMGFAPDTQFYDNIRVFSFFMDKFTTILFGILFIIMVEKDVNKIRIKYDRNN